MAKAQVTEEALAQGIESLGGFGNLGASKPRRDSPFGASFAPKRIEAPPAPEVEKAPSLAAKPPVAAALDTRPEASEVGLGVRAAVQPMKPAAATVPALRPSEQSAPRAAQQRVEKFTERITLQMTAEMRDTLDELARALQRARREKGERITSNTIMRVAIQNLLDRFSLKELKGVSSEDELLKEVKLSNSK